MVAAQCQVFKVTTTIDGGWTVTFALPEDMTQQVADIAKLRDESLYLVVMTENEFAQKQQENSSNG